MARTIAINGRNLSVEAPDGTPLLWVIRDELAMTGTKFGCGVAACGACTVHLEGVSGTAAAAVQQAWAELDVVQCGYCQSGQIMSATGLLSENAKPTDADIHDYMNGNACRCATYQRIRAAIHRAAEIMEA